MRIRMISTLNYDDLNGNQGKLNEHQDELSGNQGELYEHPGILNRLRRMLKA